jgi:hypothetical protein
MLRYAPNSTLLFLLVLSGLAVHEAAAATAVAADPVDLLKPVMELYMILEEVDQQLPNPNSWPIALRIVSSERFQQKPLKLVFNGYSDKGDAHTLLLKYYALCALFERQSCLPQCVAHAAATVRSALLL